MKTNAYGSTATTECVRHLPDTNFWHYALQLNTYKTIIEEKYGAKVVGLCLVCLHPDNANGSYQIIEVPFLEKEISELFDYRRTMVQANATGKANATCQGKGDHKASTKTTTEPKPTKTIDSYFGNTKPKAGYQPKGLMISLDTL